MKITLVILAVCLAYAVAAPSKRLILDDLANETGKILVCQGKLTEEACRQCCMDTTWYVSAEEKACELTCNVLPDAAQYITTTLLPGGPF